MKNFFISLGFVLGTVLLLFYVVVGFHILHIDVQPTLCPIITEVEYREVGYIDCYDDDGSGPWYECGEMEVRCYKDKDKKELVKCPM